MTLGIGCSRDSDLRQVSGDVKTRIPWASEGGEYSLQEVVLSGISSLYELSGSFATFYIYPSVQGSKISGNAPKTRFLKSGSVFVPQDTMTQQMAVIYAHMQRLAALDEQLGAVGINTWPRDVGVSVRYTTNGEYATNNAFYDGETDSMLVVPYTQDNLPIPVNAGILAHEHFHSLYFKLVEKKVFDRRLAIHGESIRQEVLGDHQVVETDFLQRIEKENESTVYHKAFSRGINEGLADFWAWIYTGDPNFLASSLPSEKVARSLTLQDAPTLFVTAKLFRHRLNNWTFKSEVGENCLGMRVLYCLGSEYARTLKYFAQVVQDERGLSSLEARHLVGQAVVRALPLLKEDLLSLKEKETELFEPVQFFVMIQKSLPDIKDKEKGFLEALVKNTLKPDVKIEKVTDVPTKEISKQSVRGIK